MRAFIALCLERNRTVLLTLILVLITGTYAYISIPKESEPDIPIAVIVVNIHYEGISPGDGERLLIRPMENELRGIEGIKEMTAYATEGDVGIILEFEAGFDSTKALNDVREKVDIAQSELPDGADEPVINEINASDVFPTLLVSLSGDVPLRTLVRTARDLRDDIESLPMVVEAAITGDREEVVEIIVDPATYDTYGLREDELFALATRNNRLVAAGTLESEAGRIPVKVPGLFETVYDIIDLPILPVGDSVVRVEDIALVRQTFKQPQSYARVDGLPAVTLIIKKRAGENIIGTVEAVKAMVESKSGAFPEGLVVNYSGDRSRDIRIMLTDLQNNVISAVLLVMIVVVAVLGWRTGLLVGLAVPGSFLTGILVLFMMDLTVNIVVLFSLIMAVGMLVDGAIVVTEFADRKMTEGLHRKHAYRLASQRMSLPIIASTATTLAAFAPLLFWPGMVGEFMKYMPLTMIATLTASLAMALIFIPAVGTFFGKPGTTKEGAASHLSAAEGGDLTKIPGFTGWYVRTLRAVVQRPLITLASVIFIFIGSIMLYGKFGKGFEFFPEVEPPQANLILRMRGNLSLNELDTVVREVEQEILLMDGIRTVYTQTGHRLEGEALPNDAKGIIQIEFLDWDQRRPAEEILEDIRAYLDQVPGILYEEQQLEGGPPTGKDVQIEFASRIPERLPGAVDAFIAHLETVPYARDIVDTRPVPSIEWRVNVDRAQASRFGADVAMVGNAVQFVTTGLMVGDYRPKEVDDEVEIRLRYPSEYRELDQIKRLRVNAGGNLIPISNFVTWNPAPEVGTLNRTDSRRVLEVSADLDDIALAEAGLTVDDVVNELRDWIIAEAPIPDGVEWRFRGQDEEQAQSEEFLPRAFGVALFVMGIILVTQFNSIYQALLILSAVVFSTVGVLLGLLITGQPFGIVMNGIGVIALAGIVVNNNIVLIDTFDVHRRSGMDTLEAVLRTGAQRLRPVLLTTVTTILGLLPMVFMLNIDFIAREINYGAPSTQWWVQLATSIAFGLAFATFLTLMVTPALLMLGAPLYKMGDRAKARLKEHDEAYERKMAERHAEAEQRVEEAKARQDVAEAELAEVIEAEATPPDGTDTASDETESKEPEASPPDDVDERGRMEDGEDDSSRS